MTTKKIGAEASNSGPDTNLNRDSDTSSPGGQIPPVGPHPDLAELLVGALMFSSPAEATAVLTFVVDDDVPWPLQPILTGVRYLAGRGAPPSPQLVASELRRSGKLDRQIGVALAAATTAGASGSAARHYAAATVSESLRRRVESAGAALQTAADSAAEADLAPLAAQAAAQVRDCAERLAALRGGAL